MTNKREKAIDKAKESWKKAIEWWKKILKWWVGAIWWTLWAGGYAFLSALEKWAEIATKPGGDNEWITTDEQENFDKMAEKYSKKSKEHINKAWRYGTKALKWIKEIVEWLLGVIKYGAKVIYNWIDTWDKAIGEQIEKKQLEKWKKSWKVWKLIKDNIMKLAIALSVLGFWWYKVNETVGDNKHWDKKEIVIKDEGKNEIWKLSDAEQSVKDFFDSQDIIKDLKSSWKGYEDRWVNRYLWENDDWKNGSLYGGTRGVLDWMCRMIKQWHLKMVIEKADAAWVPRQCVFLALAESCWQGSATSNVGAWWFWQFTKDTARRYGLIVNWKDYRSDPEKSTDAAMRHLKDNYKIVWKYAKDLWYNLSESDKWIFAFHMFNWSPGLVRAWIVACKWNANEYSKKLEETARKNWGCVKINGELKKVDAHQNADYVPRILAIQDVLQQIFEEYWYNVQKIEVDCLKQKIKKTSADLMYEDYVKKGESLTKEEKVNKLKEIKEKYKEEHDAKLISDSYYNWAMHIIEDEMKSY